MEISAEKVKELRIRSGAGIMDCKKALRESGGDLNDAIDFLRKAGVVKAAKKSGRAASEGLIGKSISPQGNQAALVEVNCETDFVARTDPFENFCSVLSELVISKNPKDLEGLLALSLKSGTVQEELQALIAKLGENMAIRRYALVKAGSGERIGHYLHAGSKLGVLIRIRGAKVSEESCREVAMHIAAMHPSYIDRNSVPEPVLEKEKEVISSSPDLAKKPAEVRDRIVEGKLSRYYSEACLLEQPFIKDTAGKKTVGSFLKEQDPQFQVMEMVRFQVGENA